MRTITVVGASLGGYSAAQQLRAQGFDGRLVVVGTEVHLPYDRPPLSKDFLKGRIGAADLALGEQQDFDELEAEWRLGEFAARLRPADAGIELYSGEQIGTDGVVIATGASTRVLPGSAGVGGVHTLRTLEDAQALREELTTGRPNVVVIGAGFIGAEVASSCAELGLDVTIVEAAELPLARVLGTRLASACAALHSEHGVAVRFGAGVEELRSAAGHVVGVRLSTGEELPADVVVAGIGVQPNTGWLSGSGLSLHDGVLCDSGGVTDLSNVVAVGDVARVFRPDLGRNVRTEHWATANGQPRIAVRNLLDGITNEQHTDMPYFWSDQYGVRIQFAGFVHPEDEVRILDGDIEDRCFLAQYERDGRPVGVLAFNHPRGFGRARRQLSRPTLDVATS
ncbi:3-phenylpropionate/trans-cinnamate dioxygenase ferredoxin reductase subunit [Saccharopolyspora erythraea NRRL 2338]|uniref:Ferredoxin reductase n=2 Tax=Saccharopolyspora erythraea TaxID=1836 RepID=A4FEE8_SACEN|nr:FAD-dependent oxidoreductase [Saccharopolyspora erythraea]EQD82053.1 pyridine nucleotide-disulfide oxidoreductase [Saccharopolyspora erythraea D]PFG96148.1 3-phenylpropionate/trans-cinnamate dioxygenase ferredoxin reductase subunit [Saccharopolyspora erythraea NRRL 2338]QRK92685.1 FAD-dependent oxidoreductase [Saccharopolyspora erythraea]CAM02423.1 ferredoxin reductase [Saccharopolyspora erythraea NRRL 2338]